MTKQEKIVISAYTGTLMCSIDELLQYASKLMNRPVFTHEFADSKMCSEIRERSKADFQKICEQET